MKLLLVVLLAVPACTGFCATTTRHDTLQCLLPRNFDVPQGVSRPQRLYSQPKNKSDDMNESTEHSKGVSRRSMLFSTLATTSAASLLSTPLPATASIPEIDTFGNLYTPKTDMLAGGSTAARGGVALPRRATLGPSLYETRFVAYLARFLLNFDPSARAYWNQQGFGFSWANEGGGTNNDDDTAAFAAFAESVEVGLADYFSGPFGSYSTVTAAVAGISASEPARSKPVSKKDKEQKRQGVLNLYSLLKARYNSISAKRQLAVLFSFVSDPDLQPTKEIRQLLGETDNATVSEIRLTGSVRNRGGYSLEDPPTVTVDDPPPLGDRYRRAKASPILKPTTRILRIDVVDGGEGYVTAPAVSVYSFRPVLRPCQAIAILDRFGHVESIIVLESGLGYYDSKSKPPRVQIEPPPRPGRKAKAAVKLEQEIVGVTVESGGNGFVTTEQPSVSISAPQQYPDWYVDVKTAPTMQMIQPNREALGAEVTEMRYTDGNLAYSAAGVPRRSFVMNDEFINKMGRDPLELLPSSVRPELVLKDGRSVYSVVPLAGVPQYVAVLAPRYRAYDPVFGGVGILPVTKGAAALTASEYARLALSGAVCTVVVRTLLNPLELIKTKQQLANDQELLNFARYGKTTGPDTVSEGKSIPPPDLPLTYASGEMEAPSELGTATMVSVETKTKTAETHTGSTQDDQPIGTSEMIQAMVSLRGVSSLFQSLDITFLASIPFGSFGFGATELFRRSFTEFFAAGDGSEIPLLLAASAATVITAAAVSPFEVLRVRSMGMIEPKPWKNVLEQFLQENTKNTEPRITGQFRLKELLSLWSGFAPILSRELPFALAKFLTFDFVAISSVNFLNSRAGTDSLPIQIGVGAGGLAVSALSGAIAGIAGAFVSHPADLILTKTSAQRSSQVGDQDNLEGSPAWILVVRELVAKEGGVANLFIGLSSRSLFFFLVIGLQFFLYDYVKNLFQVGSDDLSLVLDVFYSVRAGLAGIAYPSQ